MTTHENDENRPFGDAPLWIDPAAASQADEGPSAEASAQEGAAGPAAASQGAVAESQNAAEPQKPAESQKPTEPQKPAESQKPTLDGEPNLAAPLEDAAPGTWEATRSVLRERFPDTKDGVLFCVFKIQENPDVGLRDFRDEAKLRGVPVSGRSLHSAKVLLGMAEPATRKTKKQASEGSATKSAVSRMAGTGTEAADPAPGAPAPTSPATRRTNPAARAGATRRRVGEAAVGSLETQLTQALQDIQSRANADADRLRDAIAQAIEVLQAALDDSED